MDSTPTTIDQPKDGIFIPAPASLTKEQCNDSLDDAYVFNYANNPKGGKSNALRLANWEGQEKYIRQEANRIHNRLRTGIQRIMGEMVRDLGSLAYCQLHGILTSETTETGFANMLGAIKLAKEWAELNPMPLEKSVASYDDMLEEAEGLRQKRLNAP